MEKFKKSEKELTYDDFLDDLAKHKKKLLMEQALILVVAVNLIVLIFVIGQGLK